MVLNKRGSNHCRYFRLRTKWIRRYCYVTLPEVGQSFEKGGAVVEVEATKTVAEAYAPMDCTITEVNSQLETEPETINNDPCGDGWMFKAKVNAIDDSGMSYQEYEAFVS